MPERKGQKPPDARCPMCGSPMAKSPMGAAVMHLTAQQMRAMQGNKAGQPRGPVQGGMPMQRPGGR